LAEDDVVDETDRAHPTSDRQHPPIAHLRGYVREGVRVPQLDVVDPRARGLERLAGDAFELACASLPLGKVSGGGIEPTREAKRPHALVGREVGVARAHGETVGLTHGGTIDDRHGQEQVVHHAANDQQLLVVLATEDSFARTHGGKELDHHCGHAFEMARAKSATKWLGERSHPHPRLLAWRVHLADRGHEDAGVAPCSELRAVALEGARITREVFAGPKLRRIDEDRHHYERGAPLGLGDERQVTGVERPHGRNEGHAVAALPNPIARSSDVARGRCHHWKHRGHSSSPHWPARLLHVAFRGAAIPSLRLSSRLACATVAFATLVLAPPAHAAPTEDDVRAARQLFSQAEQDEDAGRWQEALDKLNRVSKVKLTAGVSYHVALCEEHLGRLATALSTFRAAQEQATSTDAQDVLRLVGAQLASLTPRVPHLTLHAEPTLHDPIVTLDGEVVDALRLDEAIAVNPGMHHVEASAPGHLSSSVTIEVHEGDVTVFRLSLAPLPPPGRAASASDDGGTQQTTPSSPPPVAAIAAAAGAGVLAGLGIGAFVAGGAAHSDAVRECASTTSCDSLKETVRIWDWTAFGARSGAAGTAGLAAFLWSRRSIDAAARYRARVVVGPGSLGVAGTF